MEVKQRREAPVVPLGEPLSFFPLFLRGVLDSIDLVELPQLEKDLSLDEGRVCCDGLRKTLEELVELLLPDVGGEGHLWLDDRCLHCHVR